MADDYGLNFGFRRSGESMSVREGRLSVPVAGTFTQGDLVTLDPAAAGFMKKAPSSSAHIVGVTGLLVQEDANLFDSIYNRIGPGILHDSYDLSRVLNNRLAIIWSGGGVKFWVRNTADVTRPDGTDVPAVTKLDFTTHAVALGDPVGWDGTKYVAINGGVTGVVGTCTFVSEDLSYAEIVLH
jgi:hypothetical protein